MFHKIAILTTIRFEYFKVKEEDEEAFPGKEKAWSENRR